MQRWRDIYRPHPKTSHLNSTQYKYTHQKSYGEAFEQASKGFGALSVAIVQLAINVGQASMILRAQVHFATLSINMFRWYTTRHLQCVEELPKHCVTLLLPMLRWYHSGDHRKLGSLHSF
jgi:hypothetical protein